MDWAQVGDIIGIVVATILYIGLAAGIVTTFLWACADREGKFPWSRE